jgi:mRNA interferase RelE/StbE
MRKLDLTRDALDFWSGLDAKQYRQVGRKITALLSDPLPPDSKRLQGREYYRADIGELRIIYTFDADVVRVYASGKRNDDEVYRR